MMCAITFKIISNYRKLYQYFEKEDEWRTLDIELKNARFSHTVFPVPHHLFSEACGNGLAVNPNLKDPLVGEDPGQFLTTPNEKVNPDVDYEELDLTSFFKVTIRSGDEDEKEENKPDKRKYLYRVLHIFSATYLRLYSLPC